MSPGKILLSIGLTLLVSRFLAAGSFPTQHDDDAPATPAPASAMPLAALVGPPDIKSGTETSLIFPSPFIPSSFSAKFTFGPATGSATFAGYIKDTGKKYSKQSNGLSYGWSKDISSKMTVRHSSRSPDARYDAFAPFDSGNKWEVAVPKGTYAVRYAVGDPAINNSVFTTYVENVFSLHERTTGHSYWIERGITVNVTDGKLTFSTPSGTVKLDWIEITGVQKAPAAPAPLTWTRSEIFAPVARIESTALQIGTKVYILGGFTHNFTSVTNEFDVFDLTTEKWSTLPSLPETQTHQGVASDGKFIYIVSGQVGTRYNNLGWHGTTDSWKFDLQANTWSPFIPAPEQRYAPSMQCINNELYLIGGCGPDRNDARDSVYVLDLSQANPKWVSKTPMPFPGDHAATIVMNNQIYYVAGEHDHSTWHCEHDFMFVYDISADKWTRLPDVPGQGSHLEDSTIAYQGEIFVFGGAGDAQVPLKRVCAFNPVTQTWTQYTGAPVGRLGATVGQLGPKVWYIGGDTFIGDSDTIDVTNLPDVLPDQIAKK